MKRKICFAAFAAAMMLVSAQAENITVDWDALNLSEEAMETASDIVATDIDTVLELKNPDSVLTEEEKEELHGNNILLADCGSFGYNFVDLDGNGTPELIIATNCPEDEFFGKMLLEVYTQDAEGGYVQVLKSEERSRYYYCGGNRIAFLASSGADDSIDTIYTFENGTLVDQKVSADPSSYVQPDLEVADFSGDEDVIEPVQWVDLSVSPLEDGEYSIGLTLPEDADETSLYALIYEEDLYDDFERLDQLKAGDVILCGGDYIDVTSVEEKEGAIVLNGGSENGGLELVAEEDTNGFFAERNGKRIYTMVGQAQLSLAETVSVNGVQTPRADVGAALQAQGTEFGPDRLTARTEHELVVEITFKL